jgi:hypothetical protein
MRADTYQDYIRGDLLIPADVAGDDFETFLHGYDKQMREVLS